ncbi:MAG: adenylyltransferase/cytidyltransferase family protein [Actinobacteria bacterium]|nr:adenylyltransferase/cytidyltransferase family protein [Actinomycetota bacterium]
MAQPPDAVVLDAPAVEQFCARRRADHQRLVLTNGCFDLLHRGHVDFLRSAATFGDVLLVGVNDDASVRALKGPGRPVTPLADRLRVLTALRWVDGVIPFGEPTADALLECVRPDVYVKGADYDQAAGGGPLPELATAQRLGVTVRFVPLTRDWSTSSLLTRLRRPE